MADESQMMAQSLMGNSFSGTPGWPEPSADPSTVSQMAPNGLAPGEMTDMNKLGGMEGIQQAQWQQEGGFDIGGPSPAALQMPSVQFTGPQQYGQGSEPGAEPQFRTSGFSVNGVDPWPKIPMDSKFNPGAQLWQAPAPLWKELGPALTAWVGGEGGFGRGAQGRQYHRSTIPFAPGGPYDKGLANDPQWGPISSGAWGHDAWGRPIPTGPIS